MRFRNLLMVLAIYFFGMALVVLTIIHSCYAAEFMAHDQVMDGFVHAQKAPQMGRPMYYLPAKKMFKNKKHKKGHPHGEQKFSRNRTHESPTPSPVPTARPSSSPTPQPTSSVSGTPGADSGKGIANGVDLRSRDSSIKDQIGPYCTAYAGAGGIENLLGKSAEDLSERHIFSMYGEYSVDAFASTVPNQKIALNSAWPRENASPKANFLSTAKHKLVSMTYIGDGDIEGAKKALNQGHPVYMGLEVPSDMASCLASIRPTTKVTTGGHAVLVVGYHLDQALKPLGGGYLVIKNSWSEACGDHGYQYLPFSYCEKSYCYFYDMQKAE